MKQEEVKHIRVIIDFDGKNYDSYEGNFKSQELISLYNSAQIVFKNYADALIKSGAYIYIDANDKRPESFSVQGISADMWNNIKNSPR